MSSKKLRVAVIGPKGQAGSCVVDELLTRGHAVVGVSRNPPKQWRQGTGDGSYTSTSVDIYTEQKKLIDIFSSDFDAIVCAYGPSLANLDTVYEDGVEAHGRMKTALLASTHDGPFIIVGGAGSIHVANRLQLTDQKDFAYSWWWTWPDEHLDYMTARGLDHGSRFISVVAVLMKWSRSHIQRPRFYSWLLRPVTYLVQRWLKRCMTDKKTIALITMCRMAFTMWNGVTEKSWTFLSPPALLRDKGVRTGEYKIFIDTPEDPATEAAENGIYNEDMAVAIVDEVENNKLAFRHWSCTGPIGLRKW
ncbi:NAD-dependent epimerase dehydratase [Colletotrichum scovillei]|uniref:NAD(P)-binding protein n=1 Tax=Colletotrichum scovillei TaxID=1209932 RepID=A0A9P7QW53_9PEZI|nr:NAD-dependent epimerase dehydratase [Colletotrichum scovillei]KAF4775362.1 NAD-dependent epimerase dehydratase [Colletotrichum scovillei]KAG7042617.1 NAD(P)-binding protein [Colletotrichum scovillei]KAG7043207.1 NAD(P)-binding protein [Colletotrichum scovillei]KAG7062654.1 NAD(P)-binding protein [Colletotrichum scovillei]